ncbi:Acyl-CoA dehydrogenase [Streptomyces venezuelae]|uniref:3-hydroxy-9,10-secoandrosta-1,3,5(10)-triene-9, 17-dione monooxygenase oxygenase subunit n=1 Tax=Streptomyces gardneri TaxID=66892 RepID=UPI0006BC9280|nr:3-hydroxy-9,10-secoandrosta-1,3,5(10)-triene-9,17-dione monooxygenase oxygenase subunit [Streptomyces gardneri]ALO13267.1 Acyl-CoA dehydrogenase [Streptomyces venezuelae]QPK49924.1 flavin-dependent monooxygenase [Streptomyces gardneri]WRK41493.1 flavin-dependent monooxygenase [Streptomyces venezuelae]CUM36042.1 POSSIBLE OXIDOREDUCTASE [Streptomyces venezuelae]
MADDVLAAIRDLAPGLRERAAEAEALRRVPDASIKEIEDTGFFQLLQPQAFGGRAADPLVFYSAVKEIAKACGSTGWVASVVGVHPWHVALFDARAQQEVWGADPKARIASSYAPTGKAAAVDGGFRLSGRWHFSSGCDHVQWVLLGCLVPDAEGNPVDMRTFLIPRSDYRVDDVWDTVGLRGSGSNDIVVEDVFVPEHRALSFGPVTALKVPGHELNREPLYRLPYAGVFTATISTPIVGIAEGAYEAYTEATRQRFRVSYGQKVAEDPFAQVRIARAASDIDASWLQMTRNIGEMYALARRDEELPMELRTRTRRDQVLATERCVAAIDLLMENAGGGAMRTGPGPVQRAWRDAHTGRGHAANDPERALVMYGQCALGIDIHDTMA